jgi:hypothetical protein
MLTDEQKQEAMDIIERILHNRAVPEDSDLMADFRTEFSTVPPPEPGQPEPETCWCGKWRHFLEEDGFEYWQSPTHRLTQRVEVDSFCPHCGFCLTDPARNAPEPVVVSVERGVISKWALRVNVGSNPTHLIPLGASNRMFTARGLLSVLEHLGIPAVLAGEEGE